MELWIRKPSKWWIFHHATLPLPGQPFFPKHETQTTPHVFDQSSALHQNWCSWEGKKNAVDTPSWRSSTISQDGFWPGDVPSISKQTYCINFRNLRKVSFITGCPLSFRKLSPIIIYIYICIYIYIYIYLHLYTSIHISHEYPFPFFDIPIKPPWKNHHNCILLHLSIAFVTIPRVIPLVCSGAREFSSPSNSPLGHVSLQILNLKKAQALHVLRQGVLWRDLYLVCREAIRGCLRGFFGTLPSGKR